MPSRSAASNTTLLVSQDAVLLRSISLFREIACVARSPDKVAENLRQDGRNSPCRWQTRADLCNADIAPWTEGQYVFISIDAYGDLYSVGYGAH